MDKAYSAFTTQWLKLSLYKAIKNYILYLIPR